MRARSRLAQDSVPGCRQSGFLSFQFLQLFLDLLDLLVQRLQVVGENQALLFQHPLFGLCHFLQVRQVLQPRNFLQPLHEGVKPELQLHLLLLEGVPLLWLLRRDHRHGQEKGLQLLDGADRIGVGTILQYCEQSIKPNFRGDMVRLAQFPAKHRDDLLDLLVGLLILDDADDSAVVAVRLGQRSLLLGLPAAVLVQADATAVVPLARLPHSTHPGCQLHVRLPEDLEKLLLVLGAVEVEADVFLVLYLGLVAVVLPVLGDLCPLELRLGPLRNGDFSQLVQGVDEPENGQLLPEVNIELGEIHIFLFVLRTLSVPGGGIP
mmetsp:Transcript_34812/g.88601  ORF Transcript_34812/g.88601 Transcript_34812/m.88601 type:complete len:321 (+) Transcript_34812:163-1125(+)